MDELRIQVVIGVITIAAIIGIFFTIKKKALELKYALAWLFVAVCVLVFDFFPQALDMVAKLFGISLASNMVFLLGIFFAMILLFVMTVTQSRMAKRITTLTQQMAIFEKKIREMEERGRKEKDVSERNQEKTGAQRKTRISDDR